MTLLMRSTRRCGTRNQVIIPLFQAGTFTTKFLARAGPGRPGGGSGPGSLGSRCDTDSEAQAIQRLISLAEAQLVDYHHHSARQVNYVLGEQRSCEPIDV